MAYATRIVSRQFSSTAAMQSIQRLTIVGGGQMGAGIAQVSAQAGMDVTVCDQTQDLLTKTENTIQKSLQRVVKKKYPDSDEGVKFFNDTIGRVSFSTSLKDAVSSADLVIEAIIENLDIKQKIFAEIDSSAPEHTLLASNTSSLPIKDIAKATKRLDKFGGLHFFNPVPMMKLLEVVRIPETSDSTFQAFLDYGQRVGKTTVKCKDTPGFIVNRLLVPYMMEAIRLLERGDASAEDIDTAMKLGCGYPMGPLELADYVGLDINKFVIDGWHRRFPDQQGFEPSPILDKLVGEGNLGKKTGKGFYDYKK